MHEEDGHAWVSMSLAGVHGSTKQEGQACALWYSGVCLRRHICAFCLRCVLTCHACARCLLDFLPRKLGVEDYCVLNSCAEMVVRRVEKEYFSSMQVSPHRAFRSCISPEGCKDQRGPMQDIAVPSASLPASALHFSSWLAGTAREPTNAALHITK